MTKGAPRDAPTLRQEDPGRSIQGETDGARLARLARQPGARVLVACPLSLMRESPAAVAKIVCALAQICDGAEIVPPGTLGRPLWQLAGAEGAILVVIARPDRSLGRGSAHELGAFRRERRPAFVLLSGRGLVDVRRIRLRALPPGERTDRVFGYLEERAP